MVFIAGLLFFFFAWVAADAIRPIPFARTAFAVASFPVFCISPIHLAETYFWELAIFNYLGWAILAAGLVRLWKSK